MTELVEAAHYVTASRCGKSIVAQIQKSLDSVLATGWP